VSPRLVARARSRRRASNPDPLIVLFSGLAPSLRARFVRHKVLQQLFPPELRTLASLSDTEGLAVKDRRCFKSLDDASEWVEEFLLERAHRTRQKWLQFESFVNLHNLARCVALWSAGCVRRGLTSGWGVQAPSQAGDLPGPAGR
jgi:hypothetical protein